MSNIYAEILERVERGEALTLKTELCGSEGLIAEGLKKTLAPYAPQTDKRGRYFADVTLTETEGKITVGEPFSPGAPYSPRCGAYCRARLRFCGKERL